MEIIAHRGVSSLLPENTLLAIQEAINLQVSTIEIDCQLSRDKEIIIFHDKTLRRLTSAGPLKVSDLNAAQLNTFDLGKGQHIPQLEKVLELVNGKCGLMLESKSLGAVKKILPRIMKLSWIDKISITSLLIKELLYVKEIAPHIPISLVLDKNIDTITTVSQYHGIKEFSISQKIAVEQSVLRYKQQGYRLRVFTVNSVAEAEMYASWGIDAIFTDCPQLFYPTLI